LIEDLTETYILFILENRKKWSFVFYLPLKKKKE